MGQQPATRGERLKCADATVNHQDGDDVLARTQMLGNVVGVVAITPGERADRAVADTLAVDPEDVPRVGAYVELRVRGNGIEIERLAEAEVVVPRIRVAVVPDPLLMPIDMAVGS